MTDTLNCMSCWRDVRFVSLINYRIYTFKLTLKESYLGTRISNKGSFDLRQELIA